MATDAPATDPGERLEPRVVPYWYIAGVVSLLVLGGLAAAGWWLFRDHTAAWVPWAKRGVLGFWSLLAAWTAVEPALSYRVWRFRVDGELLWMRYGILFVEERAVPVRRMQHVDLSAGPIERLFKLCTLVVFTAGNEGSAFKVPGLDKARAAALRDRILRARGDDVL